MKKVLVISILLALSAFISCGKKGDSGSNGAPGVGIPGANGLPGSNCTVATVAPGPVATYGGALVSCGSDSVLITNGAPGAQGNPGPVSTYGIVGLVDPCGDAPGITDEVFLLLADGTLVWSFSDNINGYNTRLAVAYDGAFQTTDGSNCSFTVSTAGNQRTISWSGGSKSWSI